MITRILILTALIACCLSNGIDSSTEANIHQVLQSRVVLDLDVDFKNEKLSGSAILTLTKITTGVLETVDLDTINLKIHRILYETGEELYFTKTESENPYLGSKLSIRVAHLGISSFQNFMIKIEYETGSAKDESDAASAALWLEPSATVDKEHPYFFTQCEATMCRSLFPHQDSPSAKLTFQVTLRIQKPLTALASGILQSKSEVGDKNVFVYEQVNKVPSYLIALAGGAIEYKRVGPNTGVYAEGSIVEAVKAEFEDMEKYLKAVSDYIGPYKWDQYNVLLLPLGFPFGGMENPSLTFATPSLIAGDKSLANVIIHEIAHSWTGNTVSMRNWEHFWVNEGFTVFLERKGVKAALGQEEAELQAEMGWYTLQDQVDAMKDKPELTPLVLDIKGRNPDDSASSIPYEKGFLFLVFLEEKVGEDNFQKILRAWIANNAYQSRDSYEFKEHYETWVRSLFDNDNAKKIIESIDWEKKLKEEGLPDRKDWMNDTIKNVQEISKDISDTAAVIGKMKEFGTSQSVYLYNLLNRSETKISQEFYDALKQMYSEKKPNDEVRFEFIQISLLSKIPDVIEAAGEFLGSTGRMKYLLPIYKAVMDMDKEKAIEFYKQHREKYHKLAIQRIDEILLK